MYKVEYTIDIYDNGSLQESPSCFTYLEIMSGNLRPMIIRGGASYILRGFGQMVYLEPGAYSEDPDNPEDKEFKMEWSCRYVSAPDFLPEGGVYDKDISLSEQVVNQYHMKQKSTKEECFKDSKIINFKGFIDFEAPAAVSLAAHGSFAWVVCGALRQVVHYEEARK
ncbi:hypothetical protein AVEN_173168-1 [Araneus ventricosus]|uniref:Uncharacterized protein n=1 Tax=Araneus ventricosus TaxID=182803 RepID=A0A4Y2TZX6_ARAVE|nr:hypothetical protein AVEN_173168-1 [Araneus ventricosus]